MAKLADLKALAADLRKGSDELVVSALDGDGLIDSTGAGEIALPVSGLAARSSPWAR